MRMIKLTSYLENVVWVNFDHISFMDDCSSKGHTKIFFVGGADRFPLLVKEDPERILKLADDDLRKYESRRVSKQQVNKATETLLKGF